MKCLKAFILFALACVAGSCTAYRYYAIESPTATFQKYRTFAWLPAVDTTGNYSDIADEKIKDEVSAQLERRNLKLEVARPDLLVRYAIQVNDKVRVYNRPVYVYGPRAIYHGVPRNRYGRYFYFRYPADFIVYVGDEIERVPYREGTLVIDLIERKSRRVIWRGYGVGDIDDPERALTDIPRVVEGIMAKLPLIPTADFHKRLVSQR
ncbi:DUF4136 domain-containing protein [Mucilaginibacter sp. UR6-11]|uniref:DUF4136 domain-containing protein n=1 Tax=Mucilaginibacter sp. UR6-11 TaxID=1435644 RepID=UPI001E346059|nr:DUF4136 domain-containing protein [Mucilaginibacter sp. UR6-11]MCC8426617.1 DUF4136 domain-containing protein [Mucilaginibacter sp. UR6-11]